MASSRRLRSCITFWLFSGWFQKSGAEICSSVWLVSASGRGRQRYLRTARAWSRRGWYSRSNSSNVMGVQSNSNKWPFLPTFRARVAPICDPHALGLVNVAAEEVRRAAAVSMNSRTARRPGMQPGADPVERGAVGRSVADQHQRVEPGESLQPLRQSAPRCIRPACRTAWDCE